MRVSIGELPATATHNERQYVFFSSREPGIAGQVTLCSRRAQGKNKYDTDRYQVRYSDLEHVVFSKLGTVPGERGVLSLKLTAIPYSVWLRDGVRPAGCNCMAGQNNKPCKHIEIAKALITDVPDFGNAPHATPTDITPADLPF